MNSKVSKVLRAAVVSALLFTSSTAFAGWADWGDGWGFDRWSCYLWYTSPYCDPGSV